MDLAAIEAKLRAGIGRQRTVEDYVSPSLVERLAVTLEQTGPVPRSGSPLPPGWHAIFCLQAPKRDALGTDGLAASDDFVPDAGMQRRMFGGARVSLHAPLVIGAPISCRSEMVDVKTRATPSSLLAIVTVRHSYSGPQGLAVVEEQDLISMEPLATGNEKPASAKPEPTSASTPPPTWTRSVTPDPIMLFRYAALTFNSHRIHYDAPYSTGVEKLPGLIVQGKLIALQLIEIIRANAPGAQLATYEFRSGRPLFAGAPMRLAAALDDTGQKAKLWAEDNRGQVAQTASMTFAAPVKK